MVMCTVQSRSDGMATIAEEMARKQKEISVSEFFERNRQILGFDSTVKALIVAVKEAVDNSLDACEEAMVLPEIYVSISRLNQNEYRVDSYNLLSSSFVSLTECL